MGVYAWQTNFDANVKNIVGTVKLCEGSLTALKANIRVVVVPELTRYLQVWPPTRQRFSRRRFTPTT